MHCVHTYIYGISLFCGNGYSVGNLIFMTSQLIINVNFGVNFSEKNALLSISVFYLVVFKCLSVLSNECDHCHHHHKFACLIIWLRLVLFCFFCVQR